MFFSNKHFYPIAGFFIICLCAIQYYGQGLWFEEHVKKHESLRKNKPLILMYTGFFPNVPYLTARGWAEVANNSTTRCTFTDNITTKVHADMLVFNSRDMPQQLPKHPRHQYWLWVNGEPPDYSGNIKLYNDTFNLTLTFAQSSELHYTDTTLFKTVRAGGFLYERAKPPEYINYALKYENITGLSTEAMDTYTFETLPGRVGDILWMVSHCDAHSLRDKLWSAIAESTSPNGLKLNGTRAGYCGQHCTKDNCDNVRIAKCAEDHNCTDSIGNYWFYFAAENYLCNNYITEKFLRTLNYATVPVVYGGMSREDYERNAPPNSFIYAEDFESPAQLVEYLIKLKGNPTKYMKYFEWRKGYDKIPHGPGAITDFGRMSMSICDWMLKNQGKQFIVGDLHDRLYSAGCREPNMTFLG